MNATTGTSSDNAVTTYYERLLLMAAKPLLLHRLFGRKGIIPAGNGTIIKFRRINSLAVATTPLGEGVDPTADVWGVTDVTATLLEYGGLVKNSDLKIMTESDGVLNGVVEAQGDQAGLTLDTLCRDVINGGSSVVRAGQVAARTDIVTSVTLADLKRTAGTLAGGNARRFTGTEFSDINQNTMPIAASYIALTHEHVIGDIVTVCGTGWVPAEKYGQGVQRLEGERGYCDGVRYVVSTNTKNFTNGGGAIGSTGLRSTSGSKVDVYTILMLGREAFGIGELSVGGTIQMFIKTPEQAGSLANRFGSSAWIARTIHKILNDDFMCRLEVGASA